MCWCVKGISQFQSLWNWGEIYYQASRCRYFKEFFTNEVKSLRSQMNSGDDCCKMMMNWCTLERALESRDSGSVERLLNGLSEDTSGIDNLDGKIIIVAANMLVKPTPHIFNLSLVEHPELWKQSKIIPLPKDGKRPFTGSNWPINLLLILSKLLEKIVFNQMKYFNENELKCSACIQTGSFY